MSSLVIFSSSKYNAGGPPTLFNNKHISDAVLLWILIIVMHAIVQQIQVMVVYFYKNYSTNVLWMLDLIIISSKIPYQDQREGGLGIPDSIMKGMPKVAQSRRRWS